MKKVKLTEEGHTVPNPAANKHRKHDVCDLLLTHFGKENDMLRKLAKVLVKSAFTNYCQPGSKGPARAAATLTGLLAGAVFAGPVNWAQQNGSVQSNGAITIKSLSGGSYSAVSNPTGAVVKANQNAVTQPPTVIIQATAGAYAEAIPILAYGTVPPTCPAGYNRVFTFSSNNCNTSPVGAQPVYNVGGTRWNLMPYGTGGTTYIIWAPDQIPPINSNGTITYQNAATLACGVHNYSSGTDIYSSWSASLCTK